MGKRALQTIYLEPVNKNKIEDIILKLNPHKTSGIRSYFYQTCEVGCIYFKSVFNDNF